MKSKRFGLVALGVLMITLSAGCRGGSPYTPQQVERGRYLVATIGCNDCHTPMKMTDHGPEPDMTRMLSGHPESLKMPQAPQ
jgi:hypothetical protein